jgi:PAS domain S-box-containing protein
MGNFLGKIKCKYNLRSNKNIVNIMESFFTCVVLVNTDAIIEHINKKGEDLFGYTLHELKNKHVNIFVPDKVKKRHLNMIHGFEYSSTRSHIIGKERTVQAQKKDGTLFDIELVLNPLILNGITKNLIFCYKSDERSRKLEQKLTDAQDISNSGSWEWDLKTGEIFLSKELQLTYNESLSFVYPDDISYIQRITEDFLINKKKKMEFVYRMNNVGGSAPLQPPYHLMNNKISHIKKFLYCKVKSVIENGEVIKIYGVTQDITDKTNMKNKLETSTNILQNISHELKSPLANIIEVCSFLEETKLNTEQQKQLSIINETINFLITIINNILQISKINSDKLSLDLESFNIRELIDVVILNYKTSINNKKLKFEYSCDSSDIPTIIIADKLKIRQILNNLLSNSIKYTNNGYIKLILKKSFNTLTFTVEDSGIGISIENQKEIFKPFSQFTKNAVGTGLGLSICKKLVESMKGEIGFSSTLNKGSSFWFSIPI